jgi:hypothetical protein
MIDLSVFLFARFHVNGLREEIWNLVHNPFEILSIGFLRYDYGMIVVPNEHYRKHYEKTNKKVCFTNRG